MLPQCFGAPPLQLGRVNRRSKTERLGTFARSRPEALMATTMHTATGGHSHTATSTATSQPHTTPTSQVDRLMPCIR